jgi:hypothetical protein
MSGGPWCGPGGLHDSACADLAELFLQEENHTPADVARLAQAIQDSIEDWFFSFEHERRQAEKHEQKDKSG